MLLTAVLSVLLLSGCEMVLTPQDSNAQQGVSTLFPLHPTQTESDTASGYRQAYPVQPFQKAYAKFLSEPNSPWFHSVTIPEMVLMPDSRTAIFYSFDGVEVYKVGTTTLDSYAFDFSYRPCLNMISYGSGSVMYGDTHKVVQTFTTENGRLRLDKTVMIASADGGLTQGEVPYMTVYEDTIPYDMGQQGACSYGSSWRTVDKDTTVTKDAVEYWLYQ